MRIVVVGLGKMGLPVAAWYASRGHAVTGCDIDPAVVALVNRGISPMVHEPGLAERIQTHVAGGRLRATCDTAAATRQADVVIVLVPLGVDPAHRPDYRALDAAFAAIGDGLAARTRAVARSAGGDTRPDEMRIDADRRVTAAGAPLILLETTVAVGDTRARFLPVLERSGARHGRDFLLAFSPERVQSGTVFRDLTTYPRVVGGIDPKSGQQAADFYGPNLGVEVKLLSSAEAAEFCKLAESVYRDVNIALANELAAYAEDCGVDAREVFPAANSQPQAHLHQPGIGVGGHCIPVYPYLLIERTRHSTLAAAARHINDAAPTRAVALLAAALGGLRGQRVLVLGLAYRPGVKESAHSPTFALVASLRAAGAEPLVHDPLYSADELRALGLPPTVLEPPPAVTAVVVQTAHTHYRALDWGRFPGLRAVLDGRAALEPVTVVAAGVMYLAIGRGERVTI